MIAHSLYWHNVPREMVSAHARVCWRQGVAVAAWPCDVDHGRWMDMILAECREPVAFFLDIDCVPLSRERLADTYALAEQGYLVGAEGCANHLDPTRVYAAPWFLMVPVQQWRDLGRPSCVADSLHDVAQRLTSAWRAAHKRVAYLEPTHCERPLWDLPGRPMAYGLGTTYSDICYHQFQARGGSALFLERCRAILGE